MNQSYALLNRTTQMFQVGMSLCEISSFVVEPQLFEPGDPLSIDMAIKNTGSENISGRTIIQIINHTGEVVWNRTYDFNGVIPMDSLMYHEVWDTTLMPQGTYLVKGYVQYDGMSTLPQSMVVMTNAPPVAQFTTNPLVLVVDEPVLFDSNGSVDNDGHLVLYQWDFGDGNQSTQQNPTHQYAYPGQYPVSLTVTDNEGANDTYSILVEIIHPYPLVHAWYPSDEEVDTSRPVSQFNISVADHDSTEVDIYLSWLNRSYQKPVWEQLYNWLDISDGIFTYSPEGSTAWLWGNTTYTWSVNVTDGISWTNKTFTFTTGGSRYDVNNDDKVNFIDAGIVWVHRTTNALYDGLYDVNQDGKVNFIDAGKTWVNRDQFILFYCSIFLIQVS